MLAAPVNKMVLNVRSYAHVKQILRCVKMCNISTSMSQRLLVTNNILQNLVSSIEYTHTVLHFQVFCILFVAILYNVHF